MIDAHLHVVSPNLPGVGPLHPILKEPAELVAAAVREELRGVSAALAMPQWNTPGDDPLGIHKTLAIAEHVPGLLPVGIADPYRGEDREHLRRVDAELARGRVAALKAYLGYLPFEPSHASYRRYYELAERYRLPVFFHTGDTYSPRAKLKHAHPLGVDEVAVDHPEVRFVIAHCGNPWLVDAAQVVYKNLNVWTDLSGLVIGDAATFASEEHKDTLADLAAGLRRAFRYAERPNRFLFGSDWPLVPVAPYRQFIAAIVPPAWHADVFEGNARMLFRLT